MPRPARARKDISEGWKVLHECWEWDLSKKVQESHRLLDVIFANHRRPVICWSGGKDSTAVLHLVTQHRWDIPVIFVDSGVEFPEALEFVNSLSTSWKLNIMTARPQAGQGFWDIGPKYGWPILGKNIASNVERAVRTGRIRPQMSAMEKTLAENRAFISARCSEFLQERPSKEVEELLQADVKIVGLRASESRARVRLWVDYGDYYFVKRYFGRNKGIWKANPIAIWTEKDIWEYHKLHKIPYSDIYSKGHSRNGCWPCAMGFRNGQLKRLRMSHPDLFKYLVAETQMGRELVRLKLILGGYKAALGIKVQNPRLLIKAHPDFFDEV